MKKFFTGHLTSVNESYFEHMRFALRFSGLLLWASATAFIHALFPMFFETTASDQVKKLSDILKDRR